MDLQLNSVRSQCPQDSHKDNRLGTKGMKEKLCTLVDSILVNTAGNRSSTWLIRCFTTHYEIFCFQSFSELFVSFLESESEVPRSSGEASGRVTNPLLSGMTPQQSTASHVPRGLPMATSTPIGTPSRGNAPPLPPLPQSAVSRPTFSAPGEGVTR